MSAGGAGGQLQLVPQAVPFSLGRTFNPHEGAAYAAAAAQQAAGPEAEATAAAVGEDATDGAVGRAGAGSSSSSSSSRLVGGRVVGRHRLDQRLLVLGLHSLPPGWEPGQPLQHQQLQQQAAGADTAAENPSEPASSEDSSGSSLFLSGEQLPQPAWSVTKSAAGSSEGAGLGTSRYQLPPVNSDRATHLLQFDGASRGNPGERGDSSAGTRPCSSTT
jgi:hypothetical protein